MRGQPDEDPAITPTRPLKRLSDANAGQRDFFVVDEVGRGGIAIQPFAQEGGSRANLFRVIGVAFLPPEDARQRGSLQFDLAIVVFDVDRNERDPVFGRGAHDLIADYFIALDWRGRLRHWPTGLQPAAVKIARFIRRSEERRVGKEWSWRRVPRH